MNDIKNPAPFYTLKEAAKELNRQLKTDYYDSKKLLSMALVYDIKLYIYAQGWDAQYVYHEVMTPEFDEYIKDEDYLSGYSEAHAIKDETIQAIVTKTIESLMDDGCLLQLPLQTIKELRLNKICEINSSLNNFQEALYIEDAYSHQVENYALGVCEIKDSQHPLLRAFLNLYDKRTVESIVDIKIYGIKRKRPLNTPYEFVL